MCKASNDRMSNLLLAEFADMLGNPTLATILRMADENTPVPCSFWGQVEKLNDLSTRYIIRQHELACDSVDDRLRKTVEEMPQGKPREFLSEVMKNITNVRKDLAHVLEGSVDLQDEDPPEKPPTGTLLN